MPDGQRCTMVAAMLLADWEDEPGCLSCGERHLAKHAVVSRKVARGALARLVETGFLRRGPRKGPGGRAQDGRFPTDVFYIENWERFQPEGPGGPRSEGPRDYIEEDLINRSRSTFKLEHPPSPSKPNKGSSTAPRVPKEHVRAAMDAYVAAMKVAHGVELAPTQPLYVAMRNIVRQYGAERAQRLAAGWPHVDNPSARAAGYPVAWIPNNEAAIEMTLRQRSASYRPVVDE